MLLFLDLLQQPGHPLQIWPDAKSHLCVATHKTISRGWGCFSQLPQCSSNIVVKLFYIQSPSTFAAGHGSNETWQRGSICLHTSKKNQGRKSDICCIIDQNKNTRGRRGALTMCVLCSLILCKLCEMCLKKVVVQKEQCLWLETGVFGVTGHYVMSLTEGRGNYCYRISSSRLLLCCCDTQL